MKFTHLTSDDRNRIESLLTKGHSISEIGESLCKSPTTVSREIAKHRYLVNRRKSVFPNNCAKRANCKKETHCKRRCLLSRCIKCDKCYKYCEDYVASQCPLLSKRGRSVCNGCHKEATCGYDRYYYDGSKAQSEYEFSLKSCREGINMSEDEFGELDRIITSRVKKGQSIAHIVANNGGSINVSERTIYKYFEQGRLTAISLDLPRKVRYKRRKARKENVCNISKSWRQYEDYKA